MSFVMMQLGSFQFSVSTAAYQELSRSTEYRWADQETFGTLPVSQYTGIGKDSISLRGVVLPEYRGGYGQVDTLRELAATGQPQQLITGEGVLLGRWCIEKIDETQGTFAAKGLPRRVDFTVQLKRFDD